MLVDYEPRSVTARNARNKRAGKLAAASLLLVLIPIIGGVTGNNPLLLLGITAAPLAGIAIATGGLIVARRQPAGTIMCAIALAANIVPAWAGWLICIHGVC